MKKLNKKVMGLTGSMVGLGVGTAVGAGVAAQIPAGSGITPGQITAPMNVATNFMPVVAMGVMGGEALRVVSKMNKKRKR
jgi:hypothetical protein